MSIADDRRERAERNYERNLAERLASATALAIKAGPNSRAQKDLDREFDAANGALLATQSELNERAPQVRFENPWLFWPPAVIIFLVEAALNKIVIDMAAGTPAPLSWAAAAIISLVLVVVSHLDGMFWRQIWSELDRKVVWSWVLLGLGCTALVGGLVTVMIVLRAYFALIAPASDLSIFDTAKAAAGLGLSFIFKAFTVPEAVGIGGLNILFLGFSFVIGFLSHDSEREYDSRYQKMKASKAAKQRDIDKYEDRQQRVYGRFARPIARSLRLFVANGGVLSSLQKDDFKQQRAEAEREAVTDTPHPAPAAPSAAAETNRQPPNVTVLAARGSQSGATNPW